jgi:hypothetical protein
MSDSKGKEQYQEMASIFGADFESEQLDEQEAAAPVKSLEEIKTDLETKTTLPTVQTETEVIKIQDEDYVKNEMRVGAEMLTAAAEMMRLDLSPQDRASKWDAFSNMMRERRETLVSLENSNTASYDRNNGLDGSGNSKINNGNINNMVFTSNDALDLILQAKNGLNPEDEVK